MLWSSLISLLICLATWDERISGAEAFTISPVLATFRRPQLAGGDCSITSTSLAATKRKRRRKVSSENDDEDDLDFSTASSELPDFDLATDYSDAPPPSKARPSMDASNEIAPEMMARPSSKPTRSVDQLIRDRSLESKFVFEDDSDDQSLPDLAVIAKSSSKKQRKGTSKMTTKERTSSASSMDDTPSFLEQIPFIKDEKTGKVTPLKVLEAGTWLGIFLLLSWEVYINTPFFDRAAPLVPVVY